MLSLGRLLIISTVIHYEADGDIYAYGPYAREIDIWADLFPEIVIAAPLRHAAPPSDSIPFERNNISLNRQLQTGGTSLLAKALQLASLPVHLLLLARAMWLSDAIQVRCPGNLGLFGCLIAPFFRKPRIAKYANSWADYPGEPTTYRWQKCLLRSDWWRAPALVYGEWPDQPPHIVPFFTSVMDERQMARALAAAPRNWSSRPLEVLFVGRLSPDKNVDVILRALALLRRDADEIRVRIIGDGPVRPELMALTTSLGVNNIVSFEGAVPHRRVLDFYERAHVLVLASQSEGWPKAMTEAMAFGLICIGSNRGLVPQILAECRGLVIEPRNHIALAEAIESVLTNRTRADDMSRAASAWSRRFTLEKLRDALADQLLHWWNLNPSQPTKCAESSKS